jgi:fructokinase
MTILICGEALFDVFLGEEFAKGFALDARIGGSAFNVAMGLARLGRPVGLLTGVSTDALGDKLARAMAEEGVETRFLKRTPAPTTLALVAVGPDGSPRYQFYGEGAADRQVEPADLPPLTGIEALVFGCFSLLTRPTGDTFLGFAQSAAGGPLVVLDPNIRPTVEPDMGVWRQRVDAFVGAADLVKVSAEDLHLMYPGEAAEDVATRWLAGRPVAVVVTRGGDGAAFFSRGGTAEVAARRVDVVDTVGAGDSFLAALLVTLAEKGLASRDELAGLSIEAARAALDFAAGAAAMTCARRGADLPRRAELAAA